MLNIFYAEPDSDRWVALDRYPRRLIRRVVRGKPQPSGMERYFLNLVHGLRRAGIDCRINDFRYASRHPDEPVGIVGKGYLLRKYAWENPIVFGPAVFSHPLNDLYIFRELSIKTVLVSAPWLKRMYESAVDVRIEVWPAGVDTYRWRPSLNVAKENDFLIYDKIRWEHDLYEKKLIQPIRKKLESCGVRYQTIRYGGYREEEYQELLGRSRAMIFLCEHETQGFAYLQALASGVPILAWDPGDFWKDPEFYPHTVKFPGVSSVPYWDNRCGIKFRGLEDFGRQLEAFIDELPKVTFQPRNYVCEKLDLVERAREYARFLSEDNSELISA